MPSGKTPPRRGPTSLRLSVSRIVTAALPDDNPSIPRPTRTADAIPDPGRPHLRDDVEAALREERHRRRRRSVFQPPRRRMVVEVREVEGERLARREPRLEALRRERRQVPIGMGTRCRLRQRRQPRRLRNRVHQPGKV